MAAVASSGSYNDLVNKPAAPTKISDLTNDSNFVDKSYLKEIIITESDWDTIHNYIQSGDAANIFSIGDVLTTEHSEYGTIQWQIAAFDQATLVDTSISHSITLVSVNCVTQLPFDCPESSGAPNNRDAINGYNRWSQSNIRQWLNSNGAADNWFTPQNDYDQCDYYSNIDGFMKGFTDSKFTSHLAVSTNITALNADDGGGSETTNDTFFLPSITEIFGFNNNNITEGIYWSTLFSTSTSRVKYYNSSASYWWLRSNPYSYNNMYYVVKKECYVAGAGSVNAGCISLGLFLPFACVVPACVVV